MLALLDSNVLGDAIAVALACVWLRHMLRRWRPDLAEFRGPMDGSTRLASGALWGLTALVAVWLVQFGVQLVGRVLNSWQRLTA